MPVLLFFVKGREVERGLRWGGGGRGWGEVKVSNTELKKKQDRHILVEQTLHLF